jgi:hypothetical protein
MPHFKGSLAKVLPTLCTLLLGALLTLRLMETDASARGYAITLLPPAVALIGMHLRWAFAHMVARGVLWALVCVAVVLSLSWQPEDLERSLGWYSFICGALPLVALLAMGGQNGRPAGDASFRPVAFGTTLTMSICLALADALVFLGPATIDIMNRSMAYSAAEGLARGLAVLNGAALVAAAWGMFRLRGWGVLLGMAGNAGMLGWLVFFQGRVTMPTVLSLLVVVNVVFQWALQAPLLMAALGGPVLAEKSERAARHLVPVMAFCLLAVLTVGAFVPLRDFSGLR